MLVVVLAICVATVCRHSERARGKAERRKEREIRTCENSGQRTAKVRGAFFRSSVLK